jgi:hypothetical protein
MITTWLFLWVLSYECKSSNLEVQYFIDNSSLSHDIQQIWLDNAGHSLYIGSSSLFISQLVIATKEVNIYAGNGDSADCIEGPALQSPMFSCYGVCGDNLGNIYASCSEYNRIVRIDSNTGVICYTYHSF